MLMKYKYLNLINIKFNINRKLNLINIYKNNNSKKDYKFSLICIVCNKKYNKIWKIFILSHFTNKNFLKNY